MTPEGVPEGEKVAIQIQGTIEYAFGSICDKIGEIREEIIPLAFQILSVDLQRLDIAQAIHDLLTAHVEKQIASLQSVTRNHGNNAIRVINNHLKNVKITRRHNRDRINPEKVAFLHLKGEKDGDQAL